MKRILFAALRFLGFYLLGIVASILITPVEVDLLGRPDWLIFVPAAVVGYVLFYTDLTPEYVFGSGPAYWTVYALGLAGVAAGVLAVLAAGGRFRRWAAPLIGIPLGFVGTLGIYYAILASI